MAARCRLEASSVGRPNGCSVGASFRRMRPSRCVSELPRIPAWERGSLALHRSGSLALPCETPRQGSVLIYLVPVTTQHPVVELTPCTACQSQVSKLALSCPQCGHPGPAADQMHRVRVLRGRFLLAVAAALFVLLGSATSLGIGLVLASIAMVVLAFSFRSDRVAIGGGRCVIGLIALLILAFIAG
jgi:hypothetical protein